MKILSPQECQQDLLQQILRENGIRPTDSPATIGLKLQNLDHVERTLAKFITDDPKMLRSKERARKLAPVKDTVLIIGPTGTGKEIIAQALGGSREEFLPLNCAALNEGTIESELFGHEKGAFTDARESKDGLLVAAGDGTVYLDEIDKMSVKIQAKLLRAIQEHEVRRMGSTKYESISCRFVCSSKVPLEKLLDEQGFLEDLYARISTFEIHTTPLADRWDDVRTILKHMLVERGLWAVDGGYPELPASWEPRVRRFNVRGIESYVENLRVFGDANYE